MPEKRNVDPFNNPPDGQGSFPWPGFDDLYDSIFDSSFASAGRTITLHLKPIVIPDSSGVESGPIATRYNPFGGRTSRRVPSQISTTRTAGTQFIYRDVEYVAHIKHGPEEDDDTGGLTLDQDEARTTTVLESLEHVLEAESCTIDGRRYQRSSVRQIGWKSTRYIMTKWKIINERQDNSNFS